jgi:hypothetical protein
VKIQVAGAGPQLPRLRQRFQHAEFLGRVSDRRLTRYATCKALMAPAIEEFGITMVEAHAAGRPVLAAAGGGALEIVDDGRTGILVAPRSVAAFADAMRSTDWESFDRECLPSSARRFSSSQFRKWFLPAVADTPARVANADNGWMASRARRRSPSPASPQPPVLSIPSLVGGSLARFRHRS